MEKHCLEGVDPEIPKTFKKGGVVVAGTNFGCGSSREHAPIALLSMGVFAVVAESFARIFFRNSINLACRSSYVPAFRGLPGMESGSPSISEQALLSFLTAKLRWKEKSWGNMP